MPITNHLRNIVATLLLLTATSAGAQSIHGYITSGVTTSQIEGDELKGFKQYGFVGGVGALTAFSDRGHWGASVEVLFSQRGAHANPSRYNAYAADLRLNYVDIPVLVHYQDFFGGMLIGAGISYARLVQQPHGELKYSPYDLIPDTNDMAFLKNDISAVLDCRFTIWRGLQLNLRWQYSLLPIKREWHFTQYVNNRPKEFANDCYNHSVALRLIYQF